MDSSETSKVAAASAKEEDIESKNAEEVASEDSTDGTSESDDLTDDDSAVFDPHLDIFSLEFDPAAAIYSSELSVPTPSAPVHDNVEAFVHKIQVISFLIFIFRIPLL